MPAAYRDSIAVEGVGTTITVDPSGITYQSGDVLVLFVVGIDPVGVPTGSDLTWTQRAEVIQNWGGFFDFTHRIYTAIADAAVTSFTLSNGINDLWEYVLTSVSDGDTTTPNDGAGASSGGDTSGDVIAPSVSPAGSDSLLLGYGRRMISGGTWTPPAGMTEREDFTNSFAFSLASLGLSASGPTGTKIFTYSVGATEEWAAMSIAIKSTGGEAPPPPLVPHLDTRLRPFNMSTGRR